MVLAGPYGVPISIPLRQAEDWRALSGTGVLLATTPTDLAQTQTLSCELLKYGLYSVRPALPDSRSFQMVLEVPRCFQMFLDVSKCVQKFLEPESHRGPTLKHRPQHRAEDTESLERLRQQISIS
eukprot:jgi/Chrzof1/13195/Cz07g24010.t1